MVSSASILFEREKQEEQQQSQLESGIPVCGANLSTPVLDQSHYIYVITLTKSITE